MSFKNATTGSEVENANKIIDDFYKAERQTKGENAEIPTAPFVTDTEKWTKLGIKRLIQMAEKGGYDHIAFSPVISKYLDGEKMDWKNFMIKL